VNQVDLIEKKQFEFLLSKKIFNSNAFILQSTKERINLFQRINQKKISSNKIRKYFKMAGIKKKSILYKTKPSVKQYILQKKQNEIINLKNGLEETVTTNRKLIFIDKTIFLAKDCRLKVWSSANQSV